MKRKQQKMVRRAKSNSKRNIETYTHTGKKRANNPPVGLVTPDTDKESGAKKTYAYDPHLDPALQWAGKTEHTSLEVPTVSLHVHERIDPRSIIEAVRKKNGTNFVQGSLFASLEENPPLREAIEFYKHAHNWSNRLVAGDSLLVMNSLIEKEGMAGKVQMVYIDPPYGIKYGSNFQPFVNKRDVKDGKDEDLTAEPEMIKAFRDTWELGIHSYLTYLRDRLLIARELLHESGSVFVQIGAENLHLTRCLMDELFGATNSIAQIAFVKTSGSTGAHLSNTCDYLLFYAKNKSQLKYRPLFLEKEPGGKGGSGYTRVELPDRSRRPMTPEERTGENPLPSGARIYCLDNLTSQSVGREKGEGAACWFPIKIDGREYLPSMQARWKTNEEGIENLQKSNRLEASGNRVGYVRYLEDFPFFPLSDYWDDVMPSYMADKTYVVQTSEKVISRCLLMTTDPGDLVFDPTCGSGTTAYVGEKWGRRWITCDTSRVACVLAKQRLMTATFDYFQLAHPHEGVDSGFTYNTVPHVTLRSLAKRESPEQEALYDQPLVDRARIRVTGPFTVEAVPAPYVKPIDDIDTTALPEPDVSVTRSGETLRQDEWRQELLKTGIRMKGGQRIEFSRVEPLPGTRWIHADGETKDAKPERVAVVFGPQHAPLEQRHVALALEEAQSLVPKPKKVVFAAFQFDPEAAKDIDEMNWPGVTLLKVQMNADLLTEDLKKKRSSNESFWYIGRPDIEIEQINKGDDKGKYRVSILGFDYYDTRSGKIESGGQEKIAMWLLDTDYDGRSLFPTQVFFPMAGEKEGWAKLARNLNAEIDEDLIEAYRGTESLLFEKGKHGRIAVKVIDDRGIESLRIEVLD
ncbi:MAG: site-specific DNA-methyltransferase [Nitrospira sp.]|nr:site-specific DNA-methyltransferase [Nitrospira sp.]